MLPGETVAKSLRRLGGGNKKLSSAQRLKAKKLGIKPTEEEIKNKEFFQTLTSLADKFIQSGIVLSYLEEVGIRMIMLGVLLHH